MSRSLLHPVRLALGAVLAAAVALSTLNTKVAGLAWLALCLLAVCTPLPARDVGTPGLRASALAWLTGCIVALALWAALSLIWHEPCCSLGGDLSSGLRLLMTAAATYILARAVGTSTLADGPTQRWLTVAVALACGLAPVLAAVQQRMFLPSHPIPWAVSVSFLVCLLLPLALDTTETRARRRLWALGSLLGIAAVLLSQSRGAYAVLAWALLLGLRAWRTRHGAAPSRAAGRRVAIVALLAALALTAATLAPGDPLRLRKAWHEVTTASEQGNFNSSMGARVYLYQLAWNGFRESPWIGLGAAERLHRIKAAGLDMPAPQREALHHVRELGHAHNQYLHNAMEGGIIGLAALLALQAGLWIAAWLLRRRDAVAGTQLWGLGWMHAIAGLSNVNLAHNYYAVMLGLSVGLVFLLASARGAAAGPGARP